MCPHVSVFLHACVCTAVALGLSVSLSTPVSARGVRTYGPGCTRLLLMPQVTQHVATCQPLSGALDNSRVILCDMMADPWVSTPSSSGLLGGACEQGMR